MTIQTLRQFDPYPGTAPGHAFDKPGIDLFGLCCHQAALHFNASIKQALATTAVDVRIRILNGKHHPCDFCTDQRFHAGWRPAVVTAGFKCYIGCCAFRFVPGFTQCVYFRMGLTGFFVPATSNHLAFKADDTTNTRVGMACIQAQTGQLQSIGHALVIECAEAHFLFLARVSNSEICRSSRPPGFSFSSLSISSRKAWTSSNLR